jgi:hypothetical protein
MLHEWGHLVDPHDVEDVVDKMAGDMPNGAGAFSQKDMVRAYMVRVVRENTAHANALSLFEKLIDYGMIDEDMLDVIKKDVEITSTTHRGEYMNPFDVIEGDDDFREISKSDPERFQLGQMIVATARAFFRDIPKDKMDKIWRADNEVAISEVEGYPRSLVPVGERHDGKRIVVKSLPNMRSINAIVYDEKGNVIEKYVINGTGIRKEMTKGGLKKSEYVVCRRKEGSVENGKKLLAEVSLILNYVSEHSAW